MWRIRIRSIWMGLLVVLLEASCTSRPDRAGGESPIQTNSEVTAERILGNPEYQAMAYGGYRGRSRDVQPTVEQLKEDMRILSALGIKVLRTYNTKLPHASNVLRAIRQLRTEDPDFEMYVMLGAWIDCRHAWTDHPDHYQEDSVANAAEMHRAVELANQYPDIVKILAVGNEAMVRWATSYYVQPGVILRWVNHLQDLKRQGKLPADLWITSSDDFASWGGGDTTYRTPDLEALIRAVDFVSLHTYPYHNTHYNPQFWGVHPQDSTLPVQEQIKRAMERAVGFAAMQFENVASYVAGIAPEKPVHIGETGWATHSNGYYGPEGSKASDEFKSALYYQGMRAWTNRRGITCFYFEAFDEPWKDAQNAHGSENHFGLFTVSGQAKYALWEQAEQGVFDGLTRDGHPVVKTHDGNFNELFKHVERPPVREHLTSPVLIP